MKNRMLHYPVSPSNDQSSQATFEELRSAVQRRIVDRIRQVEKYVQLHPVASLGAALGIGIFFGWVIKRK